MLPFWIALQFLSSFPVRLPGMPPPASVGRSLLYYPLVGALFGGVLLVMQLLLASVPVVLQAVLLLATWVALSGALHLDGLADTADAWVGGFGDRERTLTIMKDPRSGPIAIVVLVLLLLVKFAGLLVLTQSGHLIGLLLAPLIGRTALLGLFLGTPYVRKGGLGQALADHLPRHTALGVLLGVGLVVVLLGGGSGIAALLLAATGFCWLRHLLMRRLGGTTGDTAGAMVELLEVLVLVGLALLA